ncbi:hypothetical protein GWK47_011957 [Chionoecetes opilio]|uniref:Uncharacterized protein n=1 Tax=Chionoecetes opilio TaxID=41210 RepID=A0A8J4Y1L5_CHIOP|nr:hypothetical protein GWK47_011957 [Chionoecetes opilio]
MQGFERMRFGAEGAFSGPGPGPPPPGRRRPPPIFRTLPYPRCSDRWRSGDGGVAARGDQLLTPSRHVPYTAVGALGRKCCGGSPTVGGDLGIPQRQLQVSPRAAPTFRGHMRPGEPSPWGLRGAPSTTECI